MFKRSKNVRFRSFCTSMYASQLLCNFRKACIQRLRVAYNFWFRSLYKLPWRATVSSHQVQCNIPTFEALLKRNVYLFLEWCKKSNNVWLRPLLQSGCLYSGAQKNCGGTAPECPPRGYGPVGGCKETVHVQCCRWPAISAAFTAKAASWSTA